MPSLSAGVALTRPGPPGASEDLAQGWETDVRDGPTCATRRALRGWGHVGTRALTVGLAGAWNRRVWGAWWRLVLPTGRGHLSPPGSAP